MRIRGWGAYTLAWLPSIALYGGALAMQRDVTLAQGLSSGVIVMGMAAAMGVAVWHFSGRLTFPPRSLARFTLLHATAGVLYAGIWVAGLIAWIALVAGVASARVVLELAGVWHFLSGIYIYALLAGGSCLIRMQGTLRERESAAARAETAAARAQLHAVRAQLNPHFLFNALHTVASLIRSDPPAAERGVERLGDLLRDSLEHGRLDFVPLAAEWNFARAYLDLEQLRLGNRLHIESSFQPDALNVPVPPFVLQPLIENAVRHGIAPLTAGGSIRITAQRSNGALVLEVRDDGAGATPERFARGNGFGLGAVRQQVENRYGPGGRLAIESAPGAGCTATLTLPLETNG